MLDINNIYNMDCLEGLKQLDDETVSLVITDPPYGDNSGYGRNDKSILNNENPLLNLKFLFEVQDIMKNDSVIYNFTNWKHYPFIIQFVENYTCFKVRNLIVCNKSHFGLGYGFRNKHEFIIVLEKGNPKYFSADFPNVLDFEIMTHNKETHPHQKPTDLIRKIIKHSSNPTDLILDPFVGSGSIPLAAKHLNRKFIGFELDKHWYNFAKNRISQEVLSGQVQLNIQEVKHDA